MRHNILCCGIGGKKKDVAGKCEYCNEYIRFCDKYTYTGNIILHDDCLPEYDLYIKDMEDKENDNG